MKESYLLYWMGIMFLSSFIFCGNTLPADGGVTRLLSNQDKGQTFEVKSGESFLLVLPNPGSGGYVVHNPEFDTEILTLVKIEKKSPSDPNRAGDFGSLEWTFLGKGKGISPIIIRAFRPWEAGKAPILLFEASVRVNQ